jgi:SOS-response transcriptional repressor LexA
MATLKSQRLKQAREKAGFDSAQEAADAFGWKPAAYRHHENGTRGFGADVAKKYGRAFRVKPGWLLGWENVDPTLPPPSRSAGEILVVNGSVEAGVWRASEHWDDERAFVIENMPSPVPGVERFGMLVAGYSMDEFYEPGTVLDCISIFQGGTKPETGDHVIVECVRPDGLREHTVKEYREEGGRYLLVPRSTKPQFEPIEYPGPDVEHNDDSHVRVVAFVMAAYPPRQLNLMKRMGMVKAMNQGQ